MVGTKDEHVAPRESKERRIVLGGIIVSLSICRFPKRYVKKGSVVPGGFVRIFCEELCKDAQIPMYLHDETAGKVRRILKEAEQGPLSFKVELAHNTYDDGLSRYSLDLWHEPGGQATHQIAFCKSTAELSEPAARRIALQNNTFFVVKNITNESTHA